ncbi:hemagglutinin repeat-containing protein (plasmid) [Xenorhabdus stockiae]|uniref:hemagglutinin repeat-containing protein n=1 Tax=Xenorhabdus stockiae TaxID=351614 RepID=UPI003CFB10EA
MNKLCYRVIFSKTRQMLMVVSELASSHAAGQARGETTASSVYASQRVSLMPLILSISLALGLVSQPVWANIAADRTAPGHEQPTVIPTANGVTQINIQTPNPDGVSRNQYRQFDVEQKGAILNNSAVNTKTDLAGHITGNPWLAKGEAKIILNEVNSRDPSQLNGFIEVAGKRADVVIANPAGITCQGCGFINANQTTLAAGQTVLENGRLKGFEVKNGQIAVEGKGLNDTQSDHTRLIARAVKINAKLHARDLTVTTGQNRVDAQGNVVQPRASSRQDKPEFSLDVAAIGGMYANKIKLVGTEQGVGVRNAGHLGAQAGDLVLNSNGSLTNSGIMTASRDITLQNKGDVSNQGTVEARELAIRNEGHLTNRGVMKASNDLKLHHQGNLTNQGEIAAHQNITIRTRDRMENQGSLLAGRHLGIESAAVANQKTGKLAAGVGKNGQLTQPGNLTVQSKQQITNAGVMAATDTMTLTNQDKVVNQGKVQANALTINSDDDVTNAGEMVIAEAMTLTTQGKVTNQGTVQANALTIRNQGSLTNQGKMNARQDMTIQARDAVENQGSLLAGRHLGIESAALANQKTGKLAAGVGKNGQLTQPGNLTVQSKQQITNAGVMAATDTMTLSNQDKVVNQGKVQANALTINSDDDVTNAGEMVIAETMTLKTQGKVTNQGTVQANALTIRNQGSLTNQGKMSARQDMTIQTREAVENQGSLLAGRHLGIESATFANQKNGKLAAGTGKNGKLTLKSQQQITNAGVMAATDAMTLTNQDKVVNQGKVQANALTINSDDDVTNAGEMVIAEAMTLTTQGKVTNQGTVQANALTIRNQGRLTNQGKMNARQDMTIQARDAVENQGSLLAGRHLGIESAALANQKTGKLAAGVGKNGNLTLKNQQQLTNAGVMAATDAMTLTNQGKVVNQGKMQANALTINSDNDVTNTGEMVITETMTLTNQGKVTNQGTVQANALTIRNQGRLTNLGEMSARQDMTIQTREAVENQGSLLAGRHLGIESAAVANQKTGKLAAGVGKNGQLTQPGNLTVQSKQQITNAGVMAAADVMTLTNQDKVVNQGKVQANALTINSDDAVTNAGEMVIAETMTLTTPGKVTNQGTVQANDLTIRNQGRLTNLGEMSARQDMTIQAREAVENQGRLLAGRHLGIESAAFANQKTGKLAAGTGKNGNLTVQSKQQITNAGVMSATDAMTLDNQGEVINQGTVQANDLTINSDGHVTNRGKVAASNDFTLHNQGNLTNQGEIKAYRDLSISTRDRVENQGDILAGRHLNSRSTALHSLPDSLLAAGVDRQGKLTQSGNLTLTARDRAQLNGRNLAYDNLSVMATSLSLAGSLTASKDLQLTSETQLNLQAANVQARKNLTLTAPELIDNEGGNLSGETLVLHSKKLKNNQGRISQTGPQSLRLDHQAGIENNAGEIVSGGHDLIMKADTIANDNGTLSHHGSGTLSIETPQFQGQESRLLAGNQLQLLGGDYHLVNSRISVRQMMADIQSLDHRLGNMIQHGNGPLLLQVKGALDNGSGNVTGNGDVTVNAASLYNNTLTERQLNNDDNNPLKTRLEKPAINHQPGKIGATGHGRLKVAVVETLNNQAGQLLGANALQVSASEIHNQQGHLTASSGEVVLHTGHLNNQSGRIAGQQQLRLNTRAINNENGQIEADTVEIKTAQQSFNNQRGVIAAEQNLFLRSGALLNRYGRIQSGQNLWIDTHGASLDNRDSGQQAGIFSGGRLHLKTGHIQNQSGHIGSQDSLTVTGENVSNQQGQILGGKDTVLSLAELNNTQGLLQSGGKLALKTPSLINRQSGDRHGITSKQAMTLETGRLDNAEGVVVSADNLTVNAGQVNNAKGGLNAKNTLSLSSLALDNQQGKIQAGQALSVDTQGQPLENTDGVLDSQHTLTVTSGDIANRRGTLHGKSGVRLSGHQLDNQHGGKILSEQTLDVTAESLLNQQGQLLALNDLTVHVEQQIDNTTGRIHSGGNIRLNAKAVHNARTRQSDAGIEGQHIDIKADKLDNRQGQLRIRRNAELALSLGLDNTQGSILANQHLKVQGEKLALTNTNGEIKTGQSLSVIGQSATGDGKLHSLGDITLAVQKNFLHTGEILANGRLSLSSQGKLTNRSLISADTLQGQAATLTNDAMGRLLANDHQWTVKGTLNNTGLLDGVKTHLKANTLTNQGTGRIYGDHVAIEADRVSNLAGAGGRAAVMAARQRLDIGTNVLNNRGHSLIFSDGDLAVGGQLNDQQRATGYGSVINNHSAGIESTGNMQLAMTTINNVNDNLRTGLRQISQTPEQIYQMRGTRYDTKAHKTYLKDDEVEHLCVDDQRCTTDNDRFQRYDFTRTVKETRVITSDPAKILAGKNLTLQTGARGRVNNRHSQIIAGGVLTASGGRINNAETQGKRYITDEGQLESFWRIKKRGRDRQGYRSTPYNDAQVHNIKLETSTTQSGQGHVSRNRPRIEHYQGIAAQMTSVNDRPIDSTFSGEPLKRPETAPRQRQRLDVISQQPVAAGEQPFVVKTEVPDYRLPNNSLFRLNLAPRYQPPELRLNPSPQGELTELTLSPGTHPATLNLDLPSKGNAPELNLDLPSKSNTPELKLPMPSDRRGLNPPPVPDTHVLIETDPDFTQHKRWLGTDYMQNQLRWDHNNMHKRLGDGFYEQRLIRDQIINLTGQRYLGGYQSDEDQFKALMNAGIRAQQAFNLTPGIALSAEQMARLTEDMVWLVNTSVELPDGSRQTVLAPQIYVRTQGHQLDGNGAILSGSKVNLQLTGDFLNQGRVAGQDINVLADTIRNQGGHWQGDHVALLARTDMVQRGGSIKANDLTIQANRNIDIGSTVRTHDSPSGGVRHRSTYINDVAGIYVEGHDGKLRLKAGNDLNLTAAQLATQHKNSDLWLEAGRDLTLGTKKIARDEQAVFSADNRITRHESQEVGTAINSTGQIALVAGRDITAKAAAVNAGERLYAQAGRDVYLLAGAQQQQHDEYLKVKGSNSLVSSSTTTTQHQYDRQQAQSSALSGETVSVQAGRDAKIRGSNVVGTQAVSVAAGRDLSVTTAQEHNRESFRQTEKKSGLMGTGGIGFTLGSKALKQSTDSENTRHKGSTIGSSEGDVTLMAHNQARVHGSEVVAGKDLTLRGKDVAVTAAENTHTDISKTEQEQRGLTVSLGGTAGSALNTAVQTAHEAKESQNSRMQALKKTQAALSAAQAALAGQLSEVQAAKAEAINQAGGQAAKPTDVVGVQLGVGSQSSKSDTRREQTISQGSALNAGRDIRITATGEKENPGSGGDIQIQGSALNAGRDISLSAKRDMTLTSGHNTETRRGQNSSKGGNIGVGLTVGQDGTGLKFSAGGNTGKGHENGDKLTHTETQITAGGQVALNAGQNAELKGAQVRGEKVAANVGGNLHLQSEQDTDNYSSKQQNASIGASVTYGVPGGAFSAQARREKMDSQYQSVNEQTGIFAGKGGFDINVGKHTQLDGAVIASRASKDKNRLETGTLGFSDIQNKAAYQTEQQSAGISTGGAVGSQLVSNMASNTLSGTGDQDSKTSTTQAAVSEGTITIRDSGQQKQAVSQLSRDTANAANSLNPIFDKEQEQQRLAQAQTIADIGTQVLDIYTTQEAIAATKKATDDFRQPQRQQYWKEKAKAQLDKENVKATPDALADRAYQLAYHAAIKAQGADIGGNRRQAVTAVVSALQGLAGGDIQAAIAAGVAPSLANAVKAATDGNQATNLLAHAILGGVIAEMKGGSTIAGATGAVGGELAASAIAQALYPGKAPSELTPDEKEKISNLSTLAGGIAAGLTTDSTAGGVSGAQSAKNAVENNFLSYDLYTLDRKIKAAKAKGEDISPILEAERQRQAEDRAKMEASCKVKPDTCGLMREIVNEAYGEYLQNGVYLNIDPDVVSLMTQETAKDNAVISQNTSERGQMLAAAAEGAAILAGVGTGFVLPKGNTQSVKNNKSSSVIKSNVAKGAKSETDFGKTLSSNYTRQVSYKDGKEVPYGTKGSTRPDWCNKTTCSIEVKNYDLSKNQNGLINNVAKQAIERQKHLPEGMTQKIMVDIRGQKITPDQADKIISGIVQKSNGTIRYDDIGFMYER